MLETERLMWRNGSDAPLVHLDVAAIGAVDTAELNRRHAPRFFEFLAETTLVAVDRSVGDYQQFNEEKRDRYRHPS